MVRCLRSAKADFDAVASQLAAWKLDPTATPILPQRLNRNVQTFITQYAMDLPFRRRAPKPRRAPFGDGPAASRALRSSTASSLVSVAGSLPFGSEALVVPSVT